LRRLGHYLYIRQWRGQEFSLGRGWWGGGGGFGWVLGAPPPVAGGHWGSVGSEVPVLGDFCNFSIKITHFYTEFGQNKYFKAIASQIKAFEKQSKRTT